MIDEELKDIARHYGRDHQTLKAAEEFGEAATASGSRLHVLRSPDRPKHPAASIGASRRLKTTLRKSVPTAS